MRSFFIILVLFSTSIFADTKLVILGSGTPNPDPERSGSSYAIIINEKAYLVDFGPGIIRRAASLSEKWGGTFLALNPEKLDIAFLTHIHSDHTIGLADLILTPWVMGRDRKLQLYGPRDLKQMAESIINGYNSDINYRVLGTQPSNNVGYKIDFKLLKEGKVFEDKNIKVEAFLVNHGNLKDSYGFRFTTLDKIIVFSGDTSPSSNIEKFGRGADILIHEVYAHKQLEKKSKDWQKYHKAHHTSSFEVAKIAKKLKPKKLILSHVLFWGSTPQEILKEVSSIYQGKTIIAEDLMVID